MESKKVNIFAFLMTLVMCLFSIYLGMKNSVKNGVDGQQGMSAYELALKNGFIGTEKEWLESLKVGKDGLTAYEVAVSNGFKGTEGEWLQSLAGDDGDNALASVSVQDIYEAYLEKENKTSTEFTYDDFLIYYYSVVPKYDSKTATQIAYSSTVDICYTFSEYVYYLRSGTTTEGNLPAYRLYSENNKTIGGLSAGAGVIYDMIDTDEDDELDTAYIITNYHVAYIAENYSNDDNNVLYYDMRTKTTFFANKYADEDLIYGQNTVGGQVVEEYYYFLESSIEYANEEELQKTRFLNGTNNEYYGIYLYGNQDAESKLNATFVGGSADNDIAVLKVERKNLNEQVAAMFFDSNNYVPASLGDSSVIAGGEDVIAVGNPLIPDTTDVETIEQAEKAYLEAMCLSSTNGIVSVVNEACTMQSIIDSTQLVTMNLMRVSAAINSGNSGGGLYDFRGNLVGIVNSKIADSSGGIDNIGYAIPINAAEAIAKQIILQCDSDSPLNTSGRISIIKPETLGFSAENGKSNSKVIIDENGNKEWVVSYNVIAKNLDEEKQAYTSGLRNNDIIKSITFGGKEYDNETYFKQYYHFEDLLMNISLSEPTITIKVARSESGQLKEYSFTINLSSSMFEELV